ncbi:hypothetical protein HNY73_015998 [Argiope bruennichi]|uniref:Uncharacterized protein n=1 Tax=Argiope bruennichi TaxID=94029 RepID=A0A8T0EHG1_ARGBR|nr:hypothetical protein HNY73_015998 [Argiope bruennichi]
MNINRLREDMERHISLENADKHEIYKHSEKSLSELALTKLNTTSETLIITSTPNKSGTIPEKLQVNTVTMITGESVSSDYAHLPSL